MNKITRPVLKPGLIKKLQRYATANALTLTSAVNYLLVQALKETRFK